jgi:hypothetical protein
LEFRDKTTEHEEPLLNFDVHLEKGLMLSCCEEGLVKVWNSRKELLREIKFNEPIVSALFLNEEADIVIAHSG